MAQIALRINGAAREIEVDPSAPLLFVLRNTLGLTGTKLGCGLEQCGSCAVLVDSEARLSCNVPVGQFESADIVTVEGLAEGQEPGPVQRAFIAEAAAQCGYCTPGLVIAVEALRRRRAIADETEVRDALAQHLCRCGTHAAVLRAVMRLLREPGAP